jgi:methylthioribose-1-phosphate isomerase
MGPHHASPLAGLAEQFVNFSGDLRAYSGLRSAVRTSRSGMQVDGRPYRTVWIDPDKGAVRIIDQRHLPWNFVLQDLATVEETAVAIREMHVRGAGCIGATAGYGMWLAARESSGSMKRLEQLAELLTATRPTARNLSWAVERQLNVLKDLSPDQWNHAALTESKAIADEDAARCERIGEHGLPLLSGIHEKKSKQDPVQVLTHCNAGWLAFTDWGSATAPVYAAHRAGIPIHVWVDETRPRNQGSRLTAWELQNEGVPHTVIADNAGGHLMQHGKVDIVITGSDRTTCTGDVANKIGTYLKALAAHDNDIPFYVALPSSTIDWECRDGVRGIPIEERDGSEVSTVEGLTHEGVVQGVNLINPGSPTSNYAFDVTPSRLVTGLITERGICDATAEAIATLFPPTARR